ncbi:NADPH:quinone reductase-like Zn-dependent oxidoreductase [Pseudonocardia hierapolitana]|uniref:NADPH:quinone reductase-like Zn-dependent oxidoreductase n=1 Tax=Pseudonocardia hierapolitana TaxID=1128676 RepID=A0A561SXC7_9PSEU|nr:NADP-dependent oxidoreductase [Pseudonocardia hierapolitana]TWF79491.1 NADPH:quinone reductase-like Zn-dependent oxidoreductase [Pseudonocardia hierapolitana]
MHVVRQQEWGGPETLQVVEVPVPRPAPTEVLVRVVAAGVNPVDVYTRRGLAYNRVLSLPFVNGWDVAGVVEDVGYGVTRFRPGDRVFGMPWFPREAGGYAEYLVAPSRHFASIPDGMGFAEAAALPLAGLTAWQMLVDAAQVAPGHRVLVSAAAGGVGHLAVQVAKAHGAHVIGTASAAKHGFVRGLGADEVVDYTAVDVADAVSDVDVVIQMFGGDHALRALGCLRPGGIMVNAQGAWTEGMAERAAELGVRATAFLVEPDADGLDALARLVVEGRLTVHVSARFPLADVAAAHALVAEGRTTGKVVLTVSDA